MVEMYDDLKNLENIDLEKSFELSRICSKMLRDTKNEGLARKIIINVLDNWNKIDESTKELWTDLIESAGFYPYLQKYRKSLQFNNLAGEIRKEYCKSFNIPDIYLHYKQKELLDILDQNKNLIVSAPTSFGKSLLIEEIIASKKYINIVIIQPTLALLDETRKKLLKYSTLYKIIVKTSQEPSIQKGNLFLLTAERVMEYSNLPKIDFLILDEFYKLSSKRDDERSDTLNNAFNLLVNNHKCRFYLLGPNIDGISKGFEDKYNAIFYKTDYSLVDNNVIDYYSPYINQFGSRGHKKDFKELKLFELLYTLREQQTIIYCSSPVRVRYLAKKFYKYLISKKEKHSNYNIPLIEWINDNVNKSWSLNKCLSYRIGIHDGALQKHITSSIIKYFNEQKLNFLFCTSTIIEGVNTSAKNVIYFDSTKGNLKNIDYFDYSNIKGRSGRMMVHFIGNIYNFNPIPQKENILIDIPFFEQNPISDEVLININDEDVIYKSSSQYRNLEAIPPFEKEIFRKNGISIKGQQNILKILDNEIHINYSKLNWSEFPKYHQLQYILNLAWDNLLIPGETTRPMTKDKLVKVTFDYGINQNINQLVVNNFMYYKKLTKYKNCDDEDIFDDAIRDAFQVLKHWFQYKVPKWLNVVSSLQDYICIKHDMKPGNYTFYASQLENDFIRSNLTILNEYGIPRSAIDKISNSIPTSLQEDLVIEYIKKENIIEKSSSLLKYEKEKLLENLY